MTIHLIELAKRGEKSAGKPHCAFRLVQIFGNDCELVAAETADKIDFAHVRPQPRRNLLKQGVAGWMSQRIVDILEAIEIEAKHRHQLVVPARSGDSAIEMLAKLQTVGEPGERIMHRQIADLILGQPTLANAARGDRGWNRETHHDQETRRQGNDGKQDLGHERGGGLTDIDGVDALDLVTLKHGDESHPGGAAEIRRDSDGALGYGGIEVRTRCLCGRAGPAAEFVTYYPRLRAASDQGRQRQSRLAC